MFLLRHLRLHPNEVMVYKPVYTVYGYISNTSKNSGKRANTENNSAFIALFATISVKYATTTSIEKGKKSIFRYRKGQKNGIEKGKKAVFWLFYGRVVFAPFYQNDTIGIALLFDAKQRLQKLRRAHLYGSGYASGYAKKRFRYHISIWYRFASGYEVTRA